MFRGILVALTASCLALAAAAPARAQAAPASPSPRPRQSLSDAWWTGPLLAPSAGTLPRGHILAEPYLYDVMQYGRYDASGALKATPHGNSFGSLTYLIYGLADRFSVGLIPTFGYTSVAGGPNSNGIGLGDTSVLAQYRLSQFQVGRFVPTTSLSVQETFPTGRYDRLGVNPNNGFGGGVYSTKLSLYTQSYAWMPNGRILRLRLNFSQTFSGSARVNDASVFGTQTGFHGTASPGGTFTIDGAGEYSITRSWVFASDLVYQYTGNTDLSGPHGVTNFGDAHAFIFAPAMEYNWTANSGLIAGVRWFPAGRNTGASLTPVVALNMVR
ncbi:MAG: transporter [Candidatus Eremiobacteraeota bacterium]|nr:transporter [Candidatus Eremiobacteraeota bacterium]